MNALEIKEFQPTAIEPKFRLGARVRTPSGVIAKIDKIYYHVRQPCTYRLARWNFLQFKERDLDFADPIDVLLNEVVE